MNYKLNDIDYEVIVEKKNNKNTYVRVKDDLKIYVTTNYFVTNKSILKILDENKEYILKMLNKRQIKNDKKSEFMFLGNVYDIIIMPTKDVQIYEKRIYVNSYLELDKFLLKESKVLFKRELDIIYNKFDEKIPYPNLRIRKMKTRWGVCNRKNNTVTLNLDLIRFDIDKLRYVIVHELCHFVHFNHSKNFWSLVFKYKSDYKKIRKELKE